MVVELHSRGGRYINLAEQDIRKHRLLSIIKEDKSGLVPRFH